MKKEKIFKSLSIILGAAVPLTIIMIMIHFDLGSLFESWENDKVEPDWRYIWLIVFKCSIYIFPPLIGMMGFYCCDKRDTKHKFIYYFVKALNIHFLVLLSIKLLCDSILELDRIWNITLFGSIKDVQTLMGYIVTFIIQKNIKLEPGLDKPKVAEPHNNV